MESESQCTHSFRVKVGFVLEVGLVRRDLDLRETNR
jgi:hypothetical protein